MVERREDSMMRRWSGLALLAVVLTGAVAAAQVSVNVSGIGESETLLGVSIGQYAFDPGSRLLVELAGKGVGGCEDLHVERLALLNDDVIREVVYDSPVEAEAWSERISLEDSSGEPLPGGDYSIAVFTDTGAFVSIFEIVGETMEEESGRFWVSASFCGLTLQVYQLVTDQDAGAEIILHSGGHLMIALQGNPTTGFEWSAARPEGFPILEELEEPEYVADPAPGIVGSGGVFVFRYQASAQGEATLQFYYSRPWESEPPERTLEFTVIVR
jgi:predicted secreted protein